MMRGGPRGVAGLWLNGRMAHLRLSVERADKGNKSTAIKHVDGKPRSSQRECGFLCGQVITIRHTAHRLVHTKPYSRIET